MKKDFIASWNSSIQPRKQRKFRVNAPHHTRQSFMGAHLSKDLRQKLGMRSLSLRTGDTVKVVRGQHKGSTGAIRSVDLGRQRIMIEGVEHQKRDGSKSPIPLQPSNVIIIDIVQTDKRRLADAKASKQSKPVKEKPAAHSTAKKGK